MRSLSKAEAHDSQKETYASLEKGSFFTEQIGADYPIMKRIFLCVGRDAETLSVVEVSSDAFAAWLEKQTDVPNSPYRLDTEKCINKIVTADVSHPKAVESLQLIEKIKKRQKKEINRGE